MKLHMTHSFTVFIVLIISDTTRIKKKNKKISKDLRNLMDYNFINLKVRQETLI